MKDAILKCDSKTARKDCMPFNLQYDASRLDTNHHFHRHFQSQNSKFHKSMTTDRVQYQEGDSAAGARVVMLVHKV